MTLLNRLVISQGRRLLLFISGNNLPFRYFRYFKGFLYIFDKFYAQLEYRNCRSLSAKGDIGGSSLRPAKDNHHYYAMGIDVRLNFPSSFKDFLV